MISGNIFPVASFPGGFFIREVENTHTVRELFQPPLGFIEYDFIKLNWCIYLLSSSLKEIAAVFTRGVVSFSAM